MPPTFQQIQDMCLKKSVAYVGEEFTYDGQTYRGVISLIKNNRDIETGGFRVSTRVSIYVNKNDFPAVPQMGKIVFARDQEFFVAGFTQDSISYMLECEDPHR